MGARCAFSTAPRLGTRTENDIDAAATLAHFLKMDREDYDVGLESTVATLKQVLAFLVAN